MTRAVTEALLERLARLNRTRKPETTADELLAIGRRCAATLKGKPVDHGVLLYDDRPARVIIDTSAIIAILFGDLRQADPRADSST